MKTIDIHLFKNCQLVEGLTKEEVDRLIGVCEWKQFPKGDILFKEGDTSQNIYVVAEGRLGVRKHIIDKKEDNIPLLPVIAEIGEAEIVGEFSFFDGNPRSAEVFAMIDTWTLVLDPETFHQFSNHFPQVSQKITFNLIRILIGRIRKANERLSIALEWGWEVHGFVK
jgi:CRP/FNR family cyclic AMP-dependent transcriptional regulator